MTDYKVLDDLLLRPEVRETWPAGGKEPLRYLVMTVPSCARRRRIEAAPSALMDRRFGVVMSELSGKWHLQFAIRELRLRAMKGQDVLVLLAIVARPDEDWTFQKLAHALKISASEAHAAMGRLVEAGLLNPDDRMPRRKAAEEFLIHGLKYAFPCRPGALVPGVPTAHSAEPLASRIAAESKDVYVWPHARGSVRGFAVEPLYRSAPDAALNDPELYRLLALADALRLGRARERSMAAAEMTRRLRNERAHR